MLLNYDRCGNSTVQSQAPDDGHINVHVVIQQYSRKLLMMDILMSMW